MTPSVDLENYRTISAALLEKPFQLYTLQLPSALFLPHTSVFSPGPGGVLLQVLREPPDPGDPDRGLLADGRRHAQGVHQQSQPLRSLQELSCSLFWAPSTSTLKWRWWRSGREAASLKHVGLEPEGVRSALWPFSCGVPPLSHCIVYMFFFYLLSVCLLEIHFHIPTSSSGNMWAGQHLRGGTWPERDVLLNQDSSIAVLKHIRGSRLCFPFLSQSAAFVFRRLWLQEPSKVMKCSQLTSLFLFLMVPLVN